VGATFVGSGQMPLVAFLAAIPIGALATAVLVVNNVRDHENDARTGKKTLVVRFGRKFGVAEYVVLLVMAFATPGIIAAAKLGSPWILLSLAAIPRAMRVALKVATTTDGPSLSKCLADTAQLLLAHATFIALGIAMVKVR
jgi:1,4-dihydroxy-2-naphthoate octaprenyltransferase